MLTIRSSAMPSRISAVFAYLASWLQSRHAMQLDILALRHPLAVYQHSVKRPKLQPAERLLWVWLSRLWAGWQQALECVKPGTVIVWQNKRFRDYWRRLSQSGTQGRPMSSQEVRELIQDMWRSNPTWGSPGIVGELQKLGIHVAKSTVEKYRPPTSTQTAITDVEGLPSQSCQRYRGLRLFHCANGHISGALCVPHVGLRASSYGVLQCH